MRQFGGRVNNPTTSLGDLELEVPDPGRPDAARASPSPGTSPARPRSPVPTPAATTSRCKDSAEHQPRATTRSSSAARSRTRRSSTTRCSTTTASSPSTAARPATPTPTSCSACPRTMTQDAPIRKTDNGAYLSFFAQDDFRVHPRVTLNLGLRYDLQFPFTDPAGPQAGLRPRPEVAGVADRARGPALPRRPGHPPRHRPAPTRTTSPRAWASPGTRGATAACPSAPAAGIFYGSITGNEWNTTADNQPFTVRQSFPTVFTLSDPYRNLPGGVGPVPVQLRPGQPALHAARQVFGPSSTSSGRTPTR